MYSTDFNCNVAIIEETKTPEKQNFQCNGEQFEFLLSKLEFNRSACTPDTSSKAKLDEQSPDKNKGQSNLKNSENLKDIDNNLDDTCTEFNELCCEFDQLNKFKVYKKLNLDDTLKPMSYDIKKKINDINNKRRIENDDIRAEQYKIVLEDINKLKEEDPSEVDVIDIHNIFLRLLSCVIGKINKDDNVIIDDIICKKLNAFKELNKAYYHVCNHEKNASLQPVLDIENIFNNSKLYYNTLPKDPEKKLEKLVEIIETKPEMFERIKSVKELPKYAQETFKNLEKCGWPKQKMESRGDTMGSKEFNRRQSAVFPKSDPMFYWEYDINKGVDTNQNSCMVRCDLYCHKNKADLKVYERVYKEENDTIKAYYIDNDLDDQNQPKNMETYGTILKGLFKELNTNGILAKNMNDYYYEMKTNSKWSHMRDACRFINTDCGVVFFTNNHHETYKYFIRKQNNAKAAFD